MAISPGTPPDTTNPLLEALQRAPAATRGELGKVESLGGEVSDLAVFQHFTQVMPAADFFVGGDITLAGSGEVVLGNSLGNRIYGNAGSSLSNAAGHTIRGGGQIDGGHDQSFALMRRTLLSTASTIQMLPSSSTRMPIREPSSNSVSR